MWMQPHREPKPCTRTHVHTCTGTHDTPARTHKDIYPNIYMRKKETLSIYIFPC